MKLTKEQAQHAFGKHAFAMSGFPEPINIHDEGIITGYSIEPVFYIQRADGSMFTWRYDMTEVKDDGTT